MVGDNCRNSKNQGADYFRKMMEYTPTSGDVVVTVEKSQYNWSLVIHEPTWMPVSSPFYFAVPLQTRPYTVFFSAINCLRLQNNLNMEHLFYGLPTANTN